MSQDFQIVLNHSLCNEVIVTSDLKGPTLFIIAMNTNCGEML